MRKTKFFIVGLIVLVAAFLTAAWAADPVQVKLYSKPDKNSRVEATFEATIQLVPIFREKDWVKVGNPATGQVGWINMNDYAEARRAFFQPTIQTLFVQVDQNDQGRPILTVVAYKDGKKMSDKDAKALYEKLREQQNMEYKRMQRFSASIDDMMTRNLMTMHQFFDSAWRGSPQLNNQVLRPMQPLPELNEEVMVEKK